MKPFHALLSLAVLATVTPADARPKPAGDSSPPAPKEKQTDADRYFKSGVALYKENKFAEALAEFERAYEIQPHPLVLYNIAVCHRELSHYQDSVKFYKRFVTEGKGQVPAARLTAAQTELDDVLARIARLTVTVTPDGATLSVDGAELGTLVEMPLILAPGEHRIVAHAEGRLDAVRVIRVASGDELTVELMTVEVPTSSAKIVNQAVVRVPPVRKRFAIAAAFGTNLRDAADTGAPSVGIAVALGSRFELGVDAVVIAYAVMPSLRVRLAGERLSMHAIGAVPIVVPGDDMAHTFLAGAIGLGLRYRATPLLAFRLETMASFAGGEHGTTVPTFLGGELWF